MPSGLTGLKIDKGKGSLLPGPNSKSQPVSFVEVELIVPKTKLVRLLQIIHSLSTGAGLGLSKVNRSIAGWSE
jgi:hypothetical protein